MASSERGASPQRGVTTERRSQSPLCLAPSTVALILALAFVARLAEIALDIGATLRALANAKIHSNAAHSNISTGMAPRSQQQARENFKFLKCRSSKA